MASTLEYHAGLKIPIRYIEQHRKQGGKVKNNIHHQLNMEYHTIMQKTYNTSL